MNTESTAPDLVLENLGWVRRLARALARDDERAEDLVQDAWLRVRRSPPPPGRRDRAWLARVLRNLARDEHRGEARRARREREAARPTVAPSDAVLRETAARQETLVQWVFELEEPYRRTLLLRWLEGRDPARIAADESLPIATVRTRLRRGKAILRERAERESRGRGRAWLAALAGVPQPSVLPAAAPLATLATLGTVIAIMKAKLALILTLVAIAGWFVLWPGEEAVQTQAVDSNPIRRDDVQVELLAAADQGPESQRSDVEVEATIEAPTNTDPTAADPAEELGDDLVVRVVDLEGQPLVGVPVAVFQGAGQREDEWLQVTTESPSGEARFEAFGRALEKRQETAQGLLLFVGLEVPGRDLQRIPIDPDALPAEAIVLVAPAHSRLELHLVQLDGEPYPITGWTMVTPLFPHLTTAGRLERGVRRGLHIRDSHVAVFPIVEAGIPLLVAVQDLGIVRGVEHRIEGLSPGETRIVELELGATHPHAVGRIRDAQGAPLRARSIDVEFDPDGSARVYEVGEDGSFALPLERLRGTEDVFRATLQVELRGTAGGRHDVEILMGSFEARLPEDGGAVDVGDIVLRPAPLIAAGRVIDASGEPVHDAYISIYDKLNQRDDPEDFNWGFAGVDYGYTDEGGNFVVQGDIPPGEYALRAHGTGWVDRGAMRFMAGTRGLEVVVDRTRFIAGRVRLPVGVPQGDFVVHAVKPDATREEGTYASWRAGVEPDGEFAISGLRPGAMTLRLQRSGESAPLATLVGVVPTMSADEIAQGLDPWDLTEDLALLAFDVLLEDGTPARRGFAALGRRAVLIEDGRCRALLESAAGDEVLVVAPGHVPARFPVRSMPERVDLLRGTPVVVSLDTPLPALPEGWIVEISLESVDLAWIPVNGFSRDGGRSSGSLKKLWQEQLRVVPGETEWTLHAPSAGSYRPVWVVTNPPEDPVFGGGGSGSFSTRNGRYELLVERAPGAKVRFSADVDPESVAACIERLR